MLSDVCGMLWQWLEGVRCWDFECIKHYGNLTMNTRSCAYFLGFLAGLKFVTGRLTNLEGSTVGNTCPIMTVGHLYFIGHVSPIISGERHYARMSKGD